MNAIAKGVEESHLEMSLHELARGRVARVTEVRGGDAVSQRLIELGLRPNTRVCMLRRAPLGDPTVYELRGYQLCLRRSEAARVRIELLDEPGAAMP